MPRKQKPSEWKSIGFDEPSRASHATRELVHEKLTSVTGAHESVRSKYTDEILDNIIEHTDVHDGESREQLKRAILETAEWLSVDLHFQGRPSTVEKQASLRDLKKQVDHLRLTLRRLDPDTLKALETEADLDPVNPSTEPPRSIIKYQGDIRMAVIKRGLAPLAEWICRARKTLGQAKSGQPKKEAEFLAVYKLAAAWAEAHGGTAPTRRYDWLKNNCEYGPFCKFANDSLSPLGVSVSDRMAKEAIKLTKDDLKKSQEK